MLIRSLCLCTLLALSVTVADAQPKGVLKGTVVDSLTREPLPFANVFVNNTTIGTSSDLNGNFVLQGLDPGQTDVVFSYVGYQARILRFYFRSGEELSAGVVALNQKEEELQEVSVTSKRDKDWERKIRNFEKFLLGETDAQSCKIQNPWVIEFTENSTRSSLEAYADKPIEIYNYGLGYRVYFHMSGFEANPNNYRIVGQFRFEEADPLDDKQAMRWRQNRIDTYHGSERHLFKSIIDGRVEEEGFHLYVEKPGYALPSRSDIFNKEVGKSVIEFSTKDKVTKGPVPDQYFVELPPRIEVHYVNEYATRKYYKDVPFQVSWLEIQNGKIEVNSSGVVLNSIDLTTSGAMSASRVADLLPLDFKPYTEVGNIKIHPVARLTGWSKYKRMQEFTYLHTDKPYYYPGERIWMKAYMQYRDYELIDSLSKVLYVELINENKSVVDRKMLRIDSGRSVGHIDLPDTITKGNYHLRAYTNWMRNYGKENYYVRPLPVLSITDKVRDEKVEYDTTSILVHFNASKEVYSTRDSISLIISLTDQQLTPVNANVSISVTDAVLVKAIPEQPTIYDFLVTDERLWANRDFRPTYPTEQGIGFTGKFTDDKGRPTKATLSIVQRDFNTMIPTLTNSKGEFAVKGLNFSGTIDFGFQALNKKGKPFGNVTLNQRDFPPVNFEAVTLPFKSEDVTAGQIPVTAYKPGEDTRVLQDVTVKASSLEQFDPKSMSIYGKPNHVVQGSELSIATGGNLVQALQGKVPGLSVRYGWDENGLDTYQVRLRGGSSTMGVLASAEPILIVDGTPLASEPNRSVANYISSIPAQNVERVEVITSAVPMFGLRGANGAILIYTKNSGVYSPAAPANTDPNMQIIPIEGYQKQEPFRAPNYSVNADNPTPDLRSTIYWHPNLDIGQSGVASVSFYAADLQGIYRVVVEGLTANGQKVRGEYKIKVENN